MAVERVKSNSGLCAACGKKYIGDSWYRLGRLFCTKDCALTGKGLLGQRQSFKCGNLVVDVCLISWVSPCPMYLGCVKLAGTVYQTPTMYVPKGDTWFGSHKLAAKEAVTMAALECEHHPINDFAESVMTATDIDSDGRPNVVSK